MARIGAAALLVLACVPVAADVKVTFRDGQTLTGREVRREPALYLLELESGNILPIPTELVVEVELLVEGTGLPSGLRVIEPETLAGLPEGARLPTPAEQLQVLRGSASRFQKSIIDPVWIPTSDWDNDPEVGNNFNPARWYRAPIDFNWEPVDSLGKDVTHFNPVRWYQAPIDPTWYPTDGFDRTRP